MMLQQEQLLEITGRNALNLLQKEQNRAQLLLADTLSLKKEADGEYLSQEWKTAVEKENFNTKDQVEQL